MKETAQKWIENLWPWFADHGVRILFIAVIAWLLNFILARIIVRAVRIAVVRDKDKSIESEMKRENTLIRIFNGALRIVIFILSIMMILQEAGIEIAPLLASAGIVGLAVGFGGQYLIRDIITGLFIILENQYRIGDVVDIDGTDGTVEDISLRLTTLRDLNGTLHHIPHGDIKRVSNLSKKFSRINLNIAISYRSDIEHVIEVVNRTGRELAEDPAYKDSFITPPQFLRVDSFAESAVIIKILADTLPLKQWELAGELRKRIKIAFDREGLEMPLPQLVVHQVKEKPALNNTQLRP